MTDQTVTQQSQIVPSVLPAEVVQALAAAATALSSIASALSGNVGAPSMTPARNFFLADPPTCVDVINELLKVKARAGRSDGYLKLLRIGLRSFAQHVGDRPLHEIFPNEVEEWFHGMKLAERTRRGHLESVSLLFNFARRRGYARENPVAALEMPDSKIVRETKIHTPDQVKKVLDYWRRRDLDVCRHLAIRYFAGLRTCEMQRADESKIHVDRNFIEVSDAMAKQTRAPRRRRLVTIQPNLKKWLELGGEIPLRTFYHRMAQLKKCGVEFPANVTRHSFVSYHLAKFQNAGKTAMEAGHDEGVMFSNYRELVTPEAAEEYFAIIPD